MELSAKKSKVMEFVSGKQQKINYSMRTKRINKTQEEKDLGVTFLDNLSSEKTYK